MERELTCQSGLERALPPFGRSDVMVDSSLFFLIDFDLIIDPLGQCLAVLVLSCDTGWGRGLTPRSLEQVLGSPAYNIPDIPRPDCISMIKPLLVCGGTAPKKQSEENKFRYSLPNAIDRLASLHEE